jgi:hypothetical protein
MVNPAKFVVEVAYANPAKQVLLTVEVAAGCTVLQAITQSNILSQFPEINLTQNKVGIFSKIVALDTFVQPADRIEIYHALLIDPKAARLKRAKQQRNKTSKV